MTALVTVAPATAAFADDTPDQVTADSISAAVDAEAPDPVDTVRVPVQDNGGSNAPITAQGTDLQIAIPPPPPGR